MTNTGLMVGTQGDYQESPVDITDQQVSDHSISAPQASISELQFICRGRLKCNGSEFSAISVTLILSGDNNCCFMLQSAVLSDQMKSVPSFLETHSKFFDGSNISGASNMSGPAIESTVCIDINSFLIV
jgi:hypothetical protein